MSAEPIDIVVTDKVAPSVQTKFLNIATAALEAANNVDKLQAAVGKINAGNLSALARAQAALTTSASKQAEAYLKQETALNKAVEAEQRAMLASGKLADQNNKTAASFSNSQAAAERLAAAQSKTAAAASQAQTALNNEFVSAQGVTTALNKTAESATKAQIAQQKLATTQAQTAQAQAATTAQALQSAQALSAAQSNVATAQIRTATATTQAQAAQQKLAQSTTQAATAQTRAATAVTQGATAQQRLAQATAQADAAQARAALSALKLQQAQEKLAAGSQTSGGALIAMARNVAAVTGAAFSVKAVVELGDAYTTLQNKLQNVTTSQSQVETLTERLFELASKTRAPVEETATAFTRFDRALKSLGKSQEDTLRLTETVNKALTVSGATSTESASALLQLSQAFNSGKLQGDEFRSLAENMPVVLDAVAKATNTPINQVKRLSTEGKITSEVLFKAFKLIEKQIDDTFAKTTPTVAQALTVLKNNVLQTFGEINKSVGFTENLAKVVLFLADNTKALAVAAVTLGGALLVAFGPPVIAAVTAFTVAMAANPIGLLIIAISAATALFIAYGDEVSLAADKTYTLKDAAKATFQLVIEAAMTAVDYLRATFGPVIDYIASLFSDLPGIVSDVFSTIATYEREMANNAIAVFIGAYRAISTYWENFPLIFETAFKSIANMAATVVESIVNYWQTGFRSIASLVGNVLPDVAKNINDALDNITLKLPRFDISDQAKGAAGEVVDAFKSAFGRNYVGEAADAITERAKQIAEDRRETQRISNRGRADNPLRGAGPNTNVAEPDKLAVRRATLLEKVNGELNKQISSYGQLAAVRVVQEKLDEIDIQLISKKLAKMTAGEREDIKSKLETVEANKRIQQSQDAIYENASGPVVKFADSLRAINNLQKIQALNTEQVAEATRKAEYEFEQATNPLASINREISQQNELLGLNSREREVQTQILQIQNQLLPQGKVLTDAQNTALREQLTLLQKKTELTAAVTQIEAQTTEASRQLTVQQEALAVAYQRGIIGLEDYQNRLVQLQIQTANLNLDRGIGTFEDAVTASLGRILNGYKGVASGAASAFGDFFEGVASGAADSLGKAIVYGEDLGAALQDVAKTALSQLISALIKLGIQYAINAAIGQTVAATATTASAAMAGSLAVAWAPAAAFASLASFGTNAAPASVALGTTLGFAEALAAISAVGFEDGGYTGDGGNSQVAGLVHKNEFVSDASTTRRNRGTLEAMARGESVGSGGMQVEFNNYGTPQDYQVEQISENRIRIIANDAVKKEAPGAVAADMRNPNSTTSSAISGNWNVTRKR